MKLADKQREIIFKHLKELYDEISISDKVKMVRSYAPWASRFNTYLIRCKTYAATEDEFKLGGILKSGFTTFPEKLEWTQIEKYEEFVNLLKRKVEELMIYFEPSENKETAPQNNPPLSLAGLIENKGLLRACESTFSAGSERGYWDACLHALRHLETRIRKKGAFPSRVVGTDLVTKAFNPKGGKLKIPSCDDVAEEEGFMLINMGMVMFHRNAKGHREGEISRRSALKIIGYVDYLLNMLKTAVLRTNSD